MASNIMICKGNKKLHKGATAQWCNGATAQWYKKDLFNTPLI
jgi:hypothetical protein